MPSKPSLPDDLVALACDFVKLGVHIVVGRDAQTGLLELSVPYRDRAKGDERIYAYRICKQGQTVSVLPLGLDSPPCHLTSNQRHELLHLCATIEERLAESDGHPGAERAAIQT
jgi:hypothetical protein